MEVILLERIEKLGQMGDLVRVRPGYARNYLISQKKAIRATDGNRARFDAERKQLETDNLKQKSEAEGVAEKMAGTAVALVRQAGEAGQLYGSVSARDIAEALTEAGFIVTRQQVVLERPIKTIGLFDVRVRLHPEVFVTITTNVARSMDEAQIQAETGRAVVGADEEERLEADAAAAALAEQAEVIFEAEAAEDAIHAAEEEAAAEDASEDTAEEGSETADEEQETKD